MALRMSDKAPPGIRALRGELDFIHCLMTRDDFTAAVACSVTAATGEGLASEDRRELSVAHPLTDQRSQFFLAHGTCHSSSLRAQQWRLAPVVHNKAG